MDQKVAIFLFAGPETSCRLVHTLIFARDIVDRGGKARVILEGNAPAWLLELPDPAHRFHGLYQKVKEAGLIDAVCRACAQQASATAAAKAEGLRLVGDALGHVSLAPYMEAGFEIVSL